MKKILIVNNFGIGDVLFSTPLVSAIQARDPSATVSYICNPRTADFLRQDPRIDKVFIYERDAFVAVYRRSPWRFLLKWKAFVDLIHAEGFDVAYDLSGGSALSLALVFAGIPRRIGFDYKGRGRWLTSKTPLRGYEGRHVVRYNMDLLAAGSAGGGVAEDPPLMRLFVPPQDEAWAKSFMASRGLAGHFFLIMYPGGGASWGKDAGFKRWPGENWAKLAEKIIERSTCPIILMGDKSEVPLCRQVAGGMSRPPMILAGQTTLLQSAALMQRARAVVINDGGPLHMAVALGVRTVSLFGPVDPLVYGPYPVGEHKVVTKGLMCQPCYRNFRMPPCRHQSCLKTLTVEAVYQALEEWLP
ncbi:MAG: glycosyltransferase family 9 protein [Candidatus Omnitrophota bacterium]